jgi:hypothetical protein
MNTEHTPGNWESQENEVYAGDRLIAKCIAWDIPSMAYSHPTKHLIAKDDGGNANASFIALACNEHHANKAIIKELKELLYFYATNWKGEIKVLRGNPLYHGGEEKLVHIQGPIFPNDDLMLDHGRKAAELLINLEGK